MLLYKLSKRLLVMLLAIATIFSACQKELTGDVTNGPIEFPPDLNKEVTASLVSGFVIDENNQPVKDAAVKVGSSNTTTDKYGYFQVTNPRVIEIAALVTVNKSGYFPGIKTFVGVEGKGAFFRIKLLPKTIAATFNATTGGTVSLPNGLSLTFPAGAVAVVSNSSAYTGTVNVAFHHINPTSSELFSTMPGDLRGLDSLGVMRTLATYGMAAVELTGTGGELLQLATGKSAVMSMPIPAALTNAPSTLPLWYFEESIGLWRQQGRAIKVGSNYVGEVRHFSFWNCDVPSNFVQLTARFIDASGQPVRHAMVRIYRTATPTDGRVGFTDSTGYVSGAIPNNEQLTLEVYNDPICTNVIYTQSITTTNQNIALGDITVPGANTAAVSGTVQNCTGNAVTNGFVIVQNGYYYYRYPLDNNGIFRFNTTLCGASSSVTLVAEDMAAMQQSNSFPFTIFTGNNDVGVLTACGTSTSQFINYTINGVNHSFISPTDSISQQFRQSTFPSTGAMAFRNLPSISSYVSFDFTSNGIAAGSIQQLNMFYADSPVDSFQILTPIQVNITEYGPVGQFVAGNFTGTLTGAAPTNTAYAITCSFRFRRMY